VNAFASDGDHRGEAIFGPETADFGETFHVTNGKGRESVLTGAVSSRLPEPPLGGRWTFHYRDDNGGLHHIGEHAPPRRTGQLAIRYYASVDARGDLRVHAGGVPFWMAESLAEVQDKPGSVYRARMVSTFDDYQPGRDPFNGRH
jgi:hypothetical protein